MVGRAPGLRGGHSCPRQLLTSLWAGGRFVAGRDLALKPDLTFDQLPFPERTLLVGGLYKRGQEELWGTAALSLAAWGVRLRKMAGSTVHQRQTQSGENGNSKDPAELG